MHTGTSPALRIGRPGIQYVYAVLDSNNTVLETNETNNAVLAGQAVSVTGAVDVVVDNGDPSYAEAGTGWFNTVGGVYNGSGRAHAQGSGAETATWQLTGLSSGSYQVQADWKGYSDQAPNATYQIYDGATLVASVTVDQTKDAAGATINGVAFQTLATVNITSGTLRVVLSDNASGYVIADAVHVVPAAPLTDLNWVGGSLTGPTTASAGVPFTLSRTYIVSGAATGGGFTIAYYASASATFDSSAQLIGTETISAPADEAVGSHPGTSPALQIATGGTYYLYAKLDSGNAIPETDETNNVAQAPQTVTVNGTIIDNGQSGYTEVGSGWFNTVGGVYNGSARAHAKGTGANTATWQLTGLSSGSYQVQADWKGYSDQAPNATYQIYDGATLVASVTVDQTKDATGATINGVAFQTLATVNITSGTLTVVLSDNASGYVIADAVHIVAAAPVTDLNWVGGSLTGPTTASAGVPFTLSRTYIVSGAATGGGFTIAYYASASATFDSSAQLIGTETISAPADEAVGSHPGTSPALQIATGGTYYLYAKLDSGNAIPETDETNNVAQAPQTVTVNGTIIDNGQSGYTEVGSGWFNTVGGVYNGSARAHAKGTGANTATWQLTGLSSGSYQVQADWKGYSDQAPNATYQIYDGATLVASVTVDQTKDATGATINGVAFQTLATVNITSGTLTVVLSDNASGYVIADAIRVV